LEYKLKRHGIKLESVDERGTSGTCPVFTEYTKQSRRTFKCGNKACGFKGAHRDVVRSLRDSGQERQGEFHQGADSSNESGILPSQGVGSEPEEKTV